MYVCIYICMYVCTYVRTYDSAFESLAKSSRMTCRSSSALYICMYGCMCVCRIPSSNLSAKSSRVTCTSSSAVYSCMYVCMYIYMTCVFSCAEQVCVYMWHQNKPFHGFYECFTRVKLCTLQILKSLEKNPFIKDRHVPFRQKPFF